jgi:hypothetical protein
MVRSSDAPFNWLQNPLASALLQPSLVTRLATIDLWSDAISGKCCRLTVSDMGCEIEIQARGERLLTAWYPSVCEALACARERQPVTGLTGSFLAADLTWAIFPVFAGLSGS